MYYNGPYDSLVDSIVETSIISTVNCFQLNSPCVSGLSGGGRIVDRMNAFCPVGCVCLRMRPAGFDELWASTASKECRHQKRKCGAKAGCLRSKKEEEKRDDLAAEGARSMFKHLLLIYKS